MSLEKPTKRPKAPRKRIRTRRPLGTVRREAYAVGDLTEEQWTEICDWYRAKRRDGKIACAYNYTHVAAQRDHVKPISKGGMDTASNCVPACYACNSEKGQSLGWEPVARHPYMEPRS